MSEPTNIQKAISVVRTGLSSSAASAEELQKILETAIEALKSENPSVRYGCHCDLEPGMEPDGCVLDENCPHPRPSGSGGTKGTMKEEPRDLPPVSLHGVVRLRYPTAQMKLAEIIDRLVEIDTNASEYCAEAVMDARHDLDVLAAGRLYVPNTASMPLASLTNGNVNTGSLS